MREDTAQRSACLRAHSRHHRAAQCVSRRSDPDARRLGARPRRSLRAGRASGRRTWISCETYDDYPVIDVMQLEDLGFCGRARRRISCAATASRSTARFPLNTSGGQLSVGQAGAAGGFLGLVEAMRQLTGAAARRAGRDARLGLVSGFGMINYDRGLCTGAAILAARHDRAARRPKRKNPVLRAAAADAAAGRAQPRRARPHRGGRRRALRAAGLPRLRHGAVSAARGLPDVPVAAAANGARSSGGGELIAETTVLHHSQRTLLSRARAVAARHWCGSMPGRACSRICTAIAGERRRACACARNLDKSGQAVADRAAGQGHGEHGGRSDAARDDQRSEIPQGADHRRQERGRPGAWRRRSSKRAPTSCGSASPSRGSSCRASSAAKRLPQVEIVPLDLTDAKSVRDLAGADRRQGRYPDQHRRVSPRRGIADRGTETARAEMEVNYLRPAAPRAGVRPGDARARRRGHDAGHRLGQSAVDLCAVELPAHGTFSASKAAAFALSQNLRAEMRHAGIRVVNVFPGPIDDEWNQTRAAAEARRRRRWRTRSSRRCATASRTSTRATSRRT